MPLHGDSLNRTGSYIGTLIIPDCARLRGWEKVSKIPPPPKLNTMKSFVRAFGDKLSTKDRAGSGDDDDDGSDSECDAGAPGNAPCCQKVADCSTYDGNTCTHALTVCVYYVLLVT